MDVRAPYLPYEKLREVADDFLKQFHSAGFLPVPIEVIIEFDFLLDIVPMSGLKDGFDVDAFITADLTQIRVDGFIQRSRPNRYRFSLAHELAHLLIHKEVFKALKFSTIKEWKAVMCSIPQDQYTLIEWQAYALTMATDSVESVSSEESERRKLSASWILPPLVVSIQGTSDRVTCCLSSQQVRAVSGMGTPAQATTRSGRISEGL